MADSKKAGFSVLLIFISSLILIACGDEPKAVPTPFPTSATTTSTTTTITTTTVPPTTNLKTTIPSTTAARTTTEPTQPKTLDTLTPTILTPQTNEGGLRLGRSDGTGPRSKGVENVYSSAPAGNNGRVFFQLVKIGNEQVLQLKLLQLVQGTNFIETLLDNRTFVQQQEKGKIVKPADQFGVDERTIKIAISPDGTQVAYTKANYSAKPFGVLSEKEWPTDLWVANLNPQNPAPHRVVANDKDYINNPVWSTDGNRIAFVRGDFFGTGAGWLVTIWSVYKDGTRLSLLTGEDLGTVNGHIYKANRVKNMRWIGPLALSFEADDFDNGIQLWVHDLSKNSDFPRPLVLDIRWSGTNTPFCELNRRFIYVKETKDSRGLGVYSVEADKAGTVDVIPTPIVLDANGTDVFDCYGDMVLYRDGQDQISLQKINADGSLIGSRIKLGNPVAKDIKWGKVNFSPDGKFISVLVDENGKDVLAKYTYRTDGSRVSEAEMLSSEINNPLEWFGK